MQLGMIGVGRMGGNMVRRLMKAGHGCVGYGQQIDPTLVQAGMVAASGVADLAGKLATPRIVCLMVPVAAVDAILDELLPHLAAGDTVIDGGNSYYHDDITRATRLAKSGLHFVDMGTSGGVWGLERGYCLMIGGESDVVRRLDPIFASWSSRSIAGPWGQPAEYGIEMADYFSLAADHHAVAALQAPDAAGSAHVEVVDVLRSQGFGAPDVVAIEAVAAIDDRVALGQRLG